MIVLPYSDNRIHIHQAHSHCCCESISQSSDCAMICTDGGSEKTPISVFGQPIRQGASTADCKRRMVPDVAMTGNGANDTPVQSQSEREQTVAVNEGSRQRSCRGAKPVALVNRQPLDDFPMISRGAEDK